MGRVAIAGVSREVLDLAAHHDAVQDVTAGATVTFAGVVRDHDGGQSVTELEYQVHPAAGTVVAEVAADLAAREGVIAVAVTHRYGLLGVGEIALVAAVSSAHRRQAFDACSDLVDEVKRRLPVWKRQVFTDGHDEWVGST